MNYHLDTDLFTLAHRATHGLRERISTAQQTDEVAISLVARIEVLRGRFEALLKAADGSALFRAQEQLRSSEAYLAEFRIAEFNGATIREFERLRDDKKSRKMGRNDLLIACIALAHDATLVTRNTKDFTGIPGLKLENWAN